MHSSPKDWEGVSRLKLAQERKWDLQLPDLGPELYLYEAFALAGMSSIGPMGQDVPLGWSDVFYYTRSTNSLTEQWEMRVLIDMSIEYCKFKTEGEDPFCIPPAERGEDDGKKLF